MVLLGVFLVPLIVCGGFFLFFRATVTLKEFGAHVGVVFAAGGICTGIYFLSIMGALSDVEYLHGRITGKPSGTESCCHCTDVCVSSNSDGNCTATVEVCDHNEDYWWSLDSTVGRFAVEDCSGSDRPPSLWVDARVGDPATVGHRYTNYLLADPDSLFVSTAPQPLLTKVPKYPKRHGLYRFNPVVSAGVPIPSGWQEAFEQINADLGAKKQVSLAVVLTREGMEFAQAVEQRWLYGPKNALVVVLGMGPETVKWARVVTISKAETLKVELREALRDVGHVEVPGIVRVQTEKSFRRTPMAEFEYLKESFSPPIWLIILLYILSIGASVGAGVFFHREDPFEPRWRRRRFR